MARKPGRPEALRIPPAGTTDEPMASGRQEAAYEVFAEILENLGDADGFIKINRRGKSGGMEFCERLIATPDFDEEYVRRHWGGGVYSIQMFGPDPEKPGSRKYLTSVTFYIAGAPKEKKEDVDAPAAVAPGGVTAESLELRLRLATMEGMIAGMQKGGESVGGGGALDNLEKLTTIVKNLMPAPVPSGGMGAGEVFGIVRDVMSLSKEMAPESSEGTPWGMIIDKAVEPAIGLIGQALAAQKPGTSLAVADAPNPPAQIPPGPTGGPMWQAELAKIVPRLLTRARAGKDPAVAADVFLEDAPGGALVELEQLAREHPAEFVPTILALAEQYFPDVTPVRGWVEKFLQAVQESLTADDDVAADAKPALVVEPKKKKEPKKEGGADAAPGA